MTAGQGGLQHAGREAVPVLLHQQAELTGYLPARLCGQRPPVQGESAGLGRAQAGQGVQQRGLAAAVGAEQGPGLVGREGQRQRPADRPPADADREGLGLQQAAHRAAW